MNHVKNEAWPVTREWLIHYGSFILKTWFSVTPSHLLLIVQCNEVSWMDFCFHTWACLSRGGSISMLVRDWSLLMERPSNRNCRPVRQAWLVSWCALIIDQRGLSFQPHCVYYSHGVEGEKTSSKWLQVLF